MLLLPIKAREKIGSSECSSHHNVKLLSVAIVERSTKRLFRKIANNCVICKLLWAYSIMTSLQDWDKDLTGSASNWHFHHYNEMKPDDIRSVPFEKKRKKKSSLFLHSQTPSSLLIFISCTGLSKYMVNVLIPSNPTFVQESVLC